MTRNPYVGPRAFRPDEKLPARDREMRDLTDLLIAERIVLLHSPSGAGKTSLIQAGVTQRLQDEGFQPTTPLRVNTPPPPGRAVHNRYIYSIALSLFPEHDPKELEALTFPQVLEIAGLQPPDGIRVLIFDQFEEILTLNPADRDNQKAFFKELGAVLVGRPIWALFSMREDYMGGLDRFVRHLPGQLRTTYRLDLLEAAAAKIAIQEPADDQGVAFRDEAADELLRRLRRVKVQRPSQGTEEVEAPYVEPFQLQVVCRKLWQWLGNEKGDKFDSIEVGDIEQHGDIGRALRGYYSDIVRQVAKSSKADESAIRKWFQTELITEQKFRSQTTTGPISGEADPREILQALQDVYLIRSDTRAGSSWYELSHDQLIEPVLESNERWWAERRRTRQLATRQSHDTPGQNLHGARQLPADQRLPQASDPVTPLPRMRSMSSSKLFSGPPSNKVTASTLAVAVATLFWTIAAHTFWKNINTADLSLYISTSTVLLTAIVGFAVPESAAYTEHNSQRLAGRAVAQNSLTTTPGIQALEARMQELQEGQNSMAARLGITPTSAVPQSKE